MSEWLAGVALVVGLGAGWWVTDNHFVGQLALKDKAMSDFSLQVTQDTLKAKIAADKQVADTEAIWKVKFDASQAQGAKDLKNAQNEYSRRIAANQRLYVRAEVSVDNSGRAVDVSDDTAASAGRTVDAPVRLSKSTSYDLESYAYNAQQAVIALQSCQSAYRALEAK